MIGNEVAIDTSVAVKLLNDQALANRLLSSFHRACLPVVAAGELLYEAIHSQRQTENLRRYREFMDRCVVLDNTRETAEIYARTRLQLKLDAHPIPDSDIWIAATAIEHALPLLAVDRHFASVKDLVLHPVDGII